jgi:osmotically-inducible protein OsmY
MTHRAQRSRSRRYEPTPLPRIRLLIPVLAMVISACASQGAQRSCPAGGCPDDSRITADVQAQLKQRPSLAPPNRVSVQVRGGIVYLSGQVASDLQRQDAEAAARGVPGVAKVVNTIALTYGGR